MRIMLGQYLYSILTLISRLSNDLTGSLSRREFSDSMYSWISCRDLGLSMPSSPWRKHLGWAQRGLYCILRATGRRVLVPPPTWLNWNPMRASIRADLPLDWCPTTTTAGASKGFSKSCGGGRFGEGWGGGGGEGQGQGQGQGVSNGGQSRGEVTARGGEGSGRDVPLKKNLCDGSDVTSDSLLSGEKGGPLTRNKPRTTIKSRRRPPNSVPPTGSHVTRTCASVWRRL